MQMALDSGGIISLAPPAVTWVTPLLCEGRARAVRAPHLGHAVVHGVVLPAGLGGRGVGDVGLQRIFKGCVGGLVGLLKDALRKRIEAIMLHGPAWSPLLL